MALGKRINLKQTAIIAALITAAVYAVSFLAGKLGQTITEMFIAVPLNSVVTGTVGTKILAFIGGYVTLPGFLGTALVSIFVSSMVAVIIGEYLVDNFKVPTFRGFMGKGQQAGRLASIIIWGAVPVYLLLVGMVAPSMTAFIGVAIHTLAVAVVTVFIANTLKLRI